MKDVLSKDDIKIVRTVSFNDDFSLNHYDSSYKELHIAFLINNKLIDINTFEEIKTLCVKDDTIIGDENGELLTNTLYAIDIYSFSEKFEKSILNVEFYDMIIDKLAESEEEELIEINKIYQRYLQSIAKNKNNIINFKKRGLKN